MLNRLQKEKKNRFRGLRSYYEPKTKTHFVYVYDRATNNVAVSLKITGNKIQVIAGEVVR